MRLRSVALALVALVMAVVAAQVISRPPRGTGDLVASGAPVAALYPAPEFQFTDQRGAPLTSQALRGKPYIASFLFTTCRTLCPLLAAKLVLLQRRLPQPELRFVSFSVDPAHDTEAALADYQQKWQPHEDRWLLARTQPDSLAALADGFGVAVEKGETATDPIIHSATFLLVNADGMVIGAFNSTDSDSLDQLSRTVDGLLGAGAAAPLLTDGAALVHALGCLGCHADPSLAPALQGLPRQVHLETGAWVTVDEAYLRESIVSPGQKRVIGYPLLMPAYGRRLSDEQLSAMVSFLAAQPVVSDAGAPEVPLAEDPVCHMKVRVTETTPSLGVEGGVVHFCSPTCKDQYRARLHL